MRHEGNHTLLTEPEHYDAVPVHRWIGGIRRLKSHLLTEPEHYDAVPVHRWIGGIRRLKSHEAPHPFLNPIPAKLTTLFSSMFHCSYFSSSPRAFGAVFKNV